MDLFDRPTLYATPPRKSTACFKRSYADFKTDLSARGVDADRWSDVAREAHRNILPDASPDEYHRALDHAHRSILVHERMEQEHRRRRNAGHRPGLRPNAVYERRAHGDE